MFQSVRIASRSAVLTLLTALLACLPLSVTAGTAAARGDIVVVTVHGTVNATMAGMTVPLSAGAILQLPVTVRTGADGAVELRQGTSTFAAAANTEWEIPESAAEDGLVERIVQIRGNAFYNIGKRTGTRLRVEAPYLVAVIKGTQFNVAALEDSTTIALYEGHLEVRASDDSDVVDLDAGEIAIRRRNDVSINVLRLNAAARADARRNQELAARPQTDSPRSTTDAVTAGNDGIASQPQVDTAGTPTPIERGRIVDSLADSNVSVAAKAAVDVRDNVIASTDTNASLDLTAGTVEVKTGATAAVGEVASVDTGTSAAVDLSAGTVAASSDVGVDVGMSADVGAAAAVDVPAGTVDVGLDTSVASTDVGASVGVDAGSGSLGADVDLGPVDVGVGVGSGGAELDLGLGSDTGSDDGLLGGLLGRKHRN